MNDFGNITALSVCVAAIILIGWILWTMVLIPGLRYRREAKERRLTENNAALRCAHGIMKWSTCKKCAEEFAFLPTLRKSTGSSATEPFLPATGAIPGDTTAGGRENLPKSVTVEFQVGKEVLFDLNPIGDVRAQVEWMPLERLIIWGKCGVCDISELRSALVRVNNSDLLVCQKCFDLHYKGPPNVQVVDKDAGIIRIDWTKPCSACNPPDTPPKALTLSELEARIHALVAEAGYPFVKVEIRKYSAIQEVSIAISGKKTKDS